MDTNFHTHTTRCNHAFGTEREYVERAIESGLKILGFSDHTPYIFPKGYYSNFRMRPNEIDSYVDTVLDLKREYARDIEIRLGLEVEYYPAYFDRLLEFLEPYPIEYMLLGQHFVGNEIGMHYCGAETDDPEILKQYCRQSIEGLKTGKFFYFAHPDLIYFTGDEKLYRSEMRKMCEEIKELDIPIEVNLLGIAGKRNYPKESFWQIAGKVGNRVVIGADAHDPARVYQEKEIRAAELLIKAYGLKYEPDYGKKGIGADDAGCVKDQRRYA